MQQYVYPAIFYKDETEEKNFLAFYPDLNVTITGSSFEDAYLYAKNFLKVYFEHVIKYDLDFNLPTNFERLSEKYPNNKIMLLDAIIDIDKIKKPL